MVAHEVLDADGAVLDVGAGLTPLSRAIGSARFPTSGQLMTDSGSFNSSQATTRRISTGSSS